jgi:hypothetical protein
MHISDWFDVHDVDHLKAYKYLESHGHWPAGFVPQHIKQTGGWHQMITANIADAWLQIKIPAFVDEIPDSVIKRRKAPVS